MNGETDVYKEVDETIVSLCGWINDATEEKSVHRTEMMPEMTKALAELVSARAQMHQKHVVSAGTGVSGYEGYNIPITK